MPSRPLVKDADASNTAQIKCRRRKGARVPQSDKEFRLHGANGLQSCTDIHEVREIRQGSQHVDHRHLKPAHPLSKQFIRKPAGKESRLRRQPPDIGPG
jgi:hypothetical protein